MKETIDFLKQIHKYDSMIKNKLDEKEMWESIATGTTSYSSGERVQSSGSQSKMSDAIDKYIDIETEIKECVRKRKEIINVIEQLKEIEYKVLYKRYVLRMTYYEIGVSCGKTESWATTVHGRALKSVKKILIERGMLCQNSSK